MIAEVVSIGTELLLGEIVDTNAAHISRRLAEIGVDHLHSATVGDNQGRIVAVLQMALQRADVVITTGGLGPTVDDLTRQAVAQVAGRQLVSPPGLLDKIEAYFLRRGFTMTDNNRQQAFVPEGSIVIENPVGTAPAFVTEIGSHAVICLPGVPREMTYLLDTRVLPFLTERMGQPAVIVSRWIHTVGIGESVVDQMISDFMHSTSPTVGTRAHPGQTDVCITSKASTRDQALRALDVMEAAIRERLGPVVYGVDGDTLPDLVVSRLIEHKLTLAVANTVTGGSIADSLTSASGGQAVLKWAVAAADSQALALQLGIPAIEDLELRVSSIAEALCRSYGADLGLAVVQEPAEDAPLHIALASAQGVSQHSWPSRGRADDAQKWTWNYALDAVRRHLLSCGAV